MNIVYMYEYCKQLSSNIHSHVTPKYLLHQIISTTDFFSSHYYFSHYSTFV